MKIIVAQNTDHLKELLKEHVHVYGTCCDLNHIDVSKITDMSSLFFESKFNGDISRWDVSNVTDMSYMFWNSGFNGDLSKWDVSNVTDMSRIFKHSPFDGDVSRWNLISLNACDEAFSTFHDSPLGYVGVLQKNYGIPTQFPHNKAFQERLDFCESMNIDALIAAFWIYDQIHQTQKKTDIMEDLDFSFESDHSMD